MRVARLSSSFSMFRFAFLTRIAGRSWVRRLLLASVVMATALVGPVMTGFGGVASVAAATPAAVAPAATQCDPPGFPTGAGFEVSCTITIANTVTSTGGTTSSITATSCLAAAGVLPPFGLYDGRHHVEPTGHDREPMQWRGQRWWEQCYLQRVRH